jgi:DNA-directed RNA polymerase specialized sigma24 family protein
MRRTPALAHRASKRRLTARGSIARPVGVVNTRPSALLIPRSGQRPIRNDAPIQAPGPRAAADGAPASGGVADQAGDALPGRRLECLARHGRWPRRHRPTWERRGLAMENLATAAAIVAVSALPPLQAEVILLRVLAGLDTEAVARIVGRSPGAVRVAAHRGLRRLAQTLARTGVTL